MLLKPASFSTMMHFRSSATLIETGSKSYKKSCSYSPFYSPWSLYLAWLLEMSLAKAAIFLPMKAVASTVIITAAMILIEEVTFNGKRDRVVIAKDGLYSQFRDVFHCMWYCFVTITTVGYGDIFPATNNGRSWPL